MKIDEPHSQLKKQEIEQTTHTILEVLGSK